jgi:hypothetical protein
MNYRVHKSPSNYDTPKIPPARREVKEMQKLCELRDGVQIGWKVTTA